jgi:hypothetical protein
MTDKIWAERRGRCLVPGSAVAVFMLLGAGSAHAQLVDEFFPGAIPGYQANQSGSVINRIQNLDARPGVEVGDFVIRPEASESAGYDSNLLGQPGTGSPSQHQRRGQGQFGLGP